MTLTMKNATKHADALKALLKRLVKQQGEIPAAEPMEPLAALVRGCVSFDTTDARADEAMKVIHDEFVDLNELRVATELEVQEMIGPRFPDVERRVGMFIQCLNGIFAREHSIALDRVRQLPKREIRQFFRELPGIHPFVDAYVMLYGFNSAAFPIDDASFEVLRDEGVIEEDTGLEEAQKFVEHHLKDDECHRLFYCLRHRRKK